MEPGLEMDFLCFPPCCWGCPFPSPSCMGADVLLVSALAAPFAHPSRAPAAARALSPPPPPRLGPVSLGMAVESSAHSACLPCNPPSFLPPAGLFVGKFKADECRGALGLRARRRACKLGRSVSAGPGDGTGAGEHPVCGAILCAGAAAPRGMDPRSPGPGHGSGCLSVEGDFPGHCAQPPAGL